MFDEVKADHGRRRVLRRLRRELALERRADFDAGARAEADQDGMTPLLRRIEVVGQDIEGRRRRQLGARLRRHRRQIVNASDLDGAAGNFAGITAAVGTVIETAAARCRAEREQAGVGDAQAALTEFRARHLLQRPARYRDPVFAGAVLAAVASAHVLLDGVAFSVTSADGLLGGWLLAMQLAAPGLVLGVAVGSIGLRGLGHVQPAVQRLGQVVVVTLTPLLIGWAYYVAQLRVLAGDAAARGESLAIGGRRVWAQIWAAPLAPLDDYNALLLLLLGLAASAVAVYEGYAGLGDTYIGYAAVDKKYRAALVRVAAAEAAFLKQAARTIRTGIAEVEVRRRRFDRAEKTAQQAITAARGAIERYAGEVAVIEWATGKAAWEHGDVAARLRRARGIEGSSDRPALRIAAPASAVLELDPDTAAARVVEQRDRAHAAADAATAKLAACLRLLETRRTPTSSHDEELVHA